MERVCQVSLSVMYVCEWVYVCVGVYVCDVNVFDTLSENVKYGKRNEGAIFTTSADGVADSVHVPK